MAKFVIQTHFRLQEWIAHDKGYFTDEGLDYSFNEEVKSSDGKIHDQGDKRGAYQAIEKGRSADVTCACHWTVNVAASKGATKLVQDVYSVTPSGVFVPAESKIKRAEDLAGVPISVGYQSGSHYSTIQALEQYMPAADINLSYVEGMLFHRLEMLMDGRAEAVALFSGPYYLAEQLGYRKIIDTTFMISMMINADPDPADVTKYLRALRRAQRDLDLRPDLYLPYYRNEFPEQFQAMMDPRSWGPGERLVFEPYTQEAYEDSFRWIAEHGIFEGDMGEGRFDSAVITLGPKLVDA